ncbi:unnamed protein product [Chilo suppressalis]|uniref:Protein Wnt n=1 Tax=Chilo suppressalis TaxID=168631 RepID=A0ABN8B7U8_CHISP|nr:unnamed protein product [Chilo suppressalis]
MVRSVGGGGAGGLLGASLVCGRGLTERQRALCHSAPAAVAALGRGLSMAYAECRAQLAGRRWNCSGVGDDPRLGHILPMATKEAAFTYAIAAAGVTHALGAACARGDLPNCACNNGRRRVMSVPEQWEWGGCEGAAWGARFARRWLDARELEADARAAMNLHNNRVGRKVSELVKDMVRHECKCHGVSGSCAVKTCWRALPPFPLVGAALRDKYRRARLVHALPDAGAPRPPHAGGDVLPYHTPNVMRQMPQLSELVYLQPSPSYCEPDPAAAAPGTRGRHCNHTATGEEGCSHVCCGRGWRSVPVVSRDKCRCRFRWCCTVACDICVTRSTAHVCN